MQQKMKHYLYKYFTKNLSKERVITHNINSIILCDLRLTKSRMVNDIIQRADILY